MSNKIQVRRGLQANLPNPLDNGEFGWCSDSGNLYIGNGIINENLKLGGKPVTTTLDIYVATTALGGRLLSDGATGLVKRNGTTTSTSANKLVDAAAAFDSTYLNKTVHNETDDTYAKITAVDSTIQLSLSADIMASGEEYDIADALSNMPDAFSQVPAPFYSDTHLHLSPGTFSDDLTLVGKVPAGNFTLTVFGCTTGGGTIISGKRYVRQKISWQDLTFTNEIRAYFGADITWDTITLSGNAKLYTYTGSANLIQNSTVTVGNDPTNITNINSTITKGYTMYVASSTYGGDDTVADGLSIATGTATSTTANKLVDSAASFTSAVLNKTLYNSTDDTWAKVSAVDSATQLSLSADIMASGENYVIANAFSTGQRAIDTVPGTVNCNTVIKLSGETFAEDLVVMGKAFSGSYYLRLKGTLTDQLGTRNVTSATYKTVTIDGAAMTVNAHEGQLIDIVLGPGLGQKGLVLSNTGTQLTIAGSWLCSISGILGGSFVSGTTPTASSDIKVGAIATKVKSIRVTKGQKAVVVENIETNTDSFKCDTQSAAEAFGCKFSTTVSRYVWCLDQSNLDIISCYESESHNTRLTQYVTGCTGNIYNSWFKSRVAPSLNSMVVFRASKISNLQANTSGLNTEGDSVVALAYSQDTENSLTSASGTGYDVQTINKSLARGLSSAYNVYGTKTTDASSTET